ncbi:L-arabinose transport system permease protein AraP [Anaerolineae bacterium]|nr:L-arabinose transport system permease protein AraP [Anaerolineae bacterium]
MRLTLASPMKPPVPLRNDWVSRVRYHLSRQFAAYLFLLPALLTFALVAWYPITQAIQMSFQDVRLAGESTWVGLKNFELMGKDPALGVIWANALQFAVLSLTMGYGVPIFLAILIREMRNAKGFFRVVYFLPTVVPISIAVIVWRFIFDPDAGFLNSFLKVFGVEAQKWLQDPNLVKPSMVAIMTWAAFGTTTLIYLSSLQEIPTELYEAAELDGAPPLARVRFITLPHLAPIMSLLLILQVMAVVQVFTEPFLLTKGGPGRATLTPVLHIYNRAFLRADIGYASAWSLILVVALMVFSLFYQIINRRLSAD